MANNFRNISDGINVVPKTATTANSAGDVDFDTTSNKLNVHNGTTSSHIVTEAHAAQGVARLQNKDLEASTTNIVDPTDTTKKVNVQVSGATTATTTTLAAAQTANRTLTLPDITDTLAALTATQALTNKTINASLNTLSNITNANLSGTAGITGANIAAATVTGSNIAATTVAGSNMVANTVSNTQLAQMAANTIKGNNTAGLANAADLTGTQATALLTPVVGDSGTGGTKGLAPAPAAGDAAAGKYLKADGTWAAVPPGGTTTVGAIDTNANANALYISGNTLSTQSASGTNPGMMNTGTQTIAGAKTFSTSIATPTISDNANGLSISTANNKDLTLQTFATGNMKLGAANGVAIIEQSSTPLTLPPASYSSLYFKSDHNLYKLDSSGNETQIGSAGSGVNFVGLDVNNNPVNLSDRNAESSVGNWKVYQDTAGIAPVNMNGTVVDGTPITITRSTVAANVLNGVASFLVTKPAANKQGEGVSVIANIPPGYRGQGYTIQMPFKLISGSLVTGDLKLFIYDVTNSTVITPINNDILGANGVTAASFTLPSTCTQIRVGYHFASTAAGAVTLSFDDVFVGPQQVVLGPAMSDWKSDLSFTPTGFGTVTSSQFFYRRIGDTMEVQGTFAGGTPASTAIIQLPNGYTMDTTKMSTATTGQALGYAVVTNNGTSNIFATAGISLVPFFDGTINNQVFFSFAETTSGLSKTVAGSIMATGNILSFYFKFPITGWATGIASANSTVINISNYLATGTRVTGSAPTALGQYRSYLRGASNAIYSETNGTPTILPSGTSGMALYNSTNYTIADATGSPSKYEIFVGKNKSVKAQFYALANKTGFVDVTPAAIGGSISGYVQNYDPSTGIFVVAPFVSNSAMNTGLDGTGNNYTASPIYFDLVVSDNPLAVQGGGNFGSALYTGVFDNGGTTVNWNVTSATYADFTATGVPALHQLYNSRFGTVSAAASNLPGITFTAPYTGTVEVTTNYCGLTNNNGSIILTDGSNNILNGNSFHNGSANSLVNGSLSGFYDVVAGSSYTFKIRARSVSTAVSLGGDATTEYLVGFTLKYAK